ncbi:hypothetical protein ACJ6WF_45630 [Streptomyces sp. MMS24-I2-30]|uniref:hypothetical protein n=1 Tax=Streptomyces sp. MMS24-I2-30 TaxID=3351564 RepID=UPI003896A357
MIRRIAAAVVLLTAAVLLHFATPHHASFAPHPASATGPVIESEPRKLHGAASASTQIGTTPVHLETPADAPVLAPRTDRVLDASQTDTDEARAGTAVVATTGAQSRAAHPRTARETWSPAAPLRPDATLLQTFRC